MSEDVKVLVNELSKPNPDIKLVRNKTENLGIPYSADQIVLMSEVLVYLSRKSPPAGARRAKEKAL